LDFDFLQNFEPEKSAFLYKVKTYIILVSTDEVKVFPMHGADPPTPFEFYSWTKVKTNDELEHLVVGGRYVRPCKIIFGRKKFCA